MPMAILTIHSLTQSLEPTGKQGFPDGTDKHTDAQFTQFTNWPTYSGRQK